MRPLPPARLAAGATLALALLSVPPVAAADGDWPALHLAPGVAPAFVVDADGRNHVAFIQSGAIHYLTDAGGAWEEVAIPGPDQAVELDLAVDAGGKAHIVLGESSYGTHPGVSYLTNRSGAWESLRLSGAGTLGVAIAVDPFGEAHIVVSSGGSIDYFTNRKGYFKVSRLEGMYGAFYPDIALDADRRVHVVFEVQVGTTGIHYLTNAGGHWKLERISSGPGDTDSRPSVDLGADGSVHVAYASSGAGGGIRHATNEGGTWETSTVSALAGAAEPSLTLAGGTPRVAFLADGVLLATRAGGSWSAVRVNDRGGGASVAIAPGDERRIVFERIVLGAGNTVMMASSAVAPWLLEQVTDGDDRRPAVARGADGSLHIAWDRGAGGPGILYATDRSGLMVTTQLTSEADTEPSIGLDGDGHVFIAFRRAGATWETSGVFLVTDAAGAWETSRIREGDAQEKYGDTNDYCPSLSVDAGGHLQVVMHDAIVPSGSGGWRPTLAHFTNATGAWVRTELPGMDPGEFPPSCTSLVTDGASRAHVAWLSWVFDVSRIRYATNESGEWATTSAETGAVLEPTIALGADGRVSIAFGMGDQYAQSGFVLLTRDSGSWERQAVSSTGFPWGTRPAVSVGPLGADIAFLAEGVHYATNRGGAWTTHRLTSGADTFAGSGANAPGLLVEAGGLVRILFPRSGAGLFFISGGE